MLNSAIGYPTVCRRHAAKAAALLPLPPELSTLSGDCFFFAAACFFAIADSGKRFVQYRAARDPCGELTRKRR